MFNMNLQGVKHKYRIINTGSVGLIHNFDTNRQCPTGRVGSGRSGLVGSGRILEKIPGSGSGLG